jgi:PPOX class probable F420-dependent enzyme
MEISDTVVKHLLATWPVARLATLNSDGSPHQIPIVFTWHEGCFWSPIDGKPKRSGQPTRVDNVIANPIASLLIDKYDADWTQLWWIRAELEVTVIRLNEVNPETLEQARQAKRKLEEKYSQYESTAVLREPATILTMRPTAIMSWSASRVEI